MILADHDDVLASDLMGKVLGGEEVGKVLVPGGDLWIVSTSGRDDFGKVLFPGGDLLNISAGGEEFRKIWFPEEIWEMFRCREKLNLEKF